MLLLVAVLLSQTTVVQQGRSRDGGVPWPVTVTGTATITGTIACSNCSASGGGDGGTVVVSTVGLTDTQLRASAVPVSIASMPSTPVTGPLTDAQLRATPVPISGSVTATGPLTDTQLRASAVPVSGPLTDTQLRATPVPVSGTVTSNQGAAPWQVTSQKRAAAALAQAVSCATTATALPTSVLASRVSLCVYNNGAAAMYLGHSGVTTATGFPLPVGGVWCDDPGSQPLYCIVAAGTVEARIVEN